MQDFNAFLNEGKLTSKNSLVMAYEADADWQKNKTNAFMMKSFFEDAIDNLDGIIKSYSNFTFNMGNDKDINIFKGSFVYDQHVKLQDGMKKYVKLLEQNLDELKKFRDKTLSELKK